MVMVMMTKKESDWGTWEELLLGGAVLRHGTGDWTVVADELRSHSLFPEIFTAEICEAKYEDLGEHYNMGFKAWYEELKKKRVSELKAALLKSQDSIGSLESKLQSLKSESNDKYDSSRTVSLEPCQKSEGGECTSKDTSKDLSSAGSFTQQELTTKWSPVEIKPEPEPEPEPSAIEHEKHLYGDIFESMYGGHVLPSMRKKRGKRKRKDCSISSGKDVTEVSAVESNLLDSSVDIVSISSSSQSRGHDVVFPKELMKIYNTVAENECALVFRRRLDSQKRGRYKKLVRRHMDFDTIQSRINNCSISSVKELFRDLLLVANNAALFYSKNTREHKSAVSLRDIVTKSLRHYLTEGHKVPALPPTSTSPVQTSLTAKKQRTGTTTLKTGQRKTGAVLQDIVKTSSGVKRKLITDSTVAARKSLPAGKKGTVTAGRRVDSRQTNRGVDCPASSGRKRKQFDIDHLNDEHLVSVEGY